MRLKEITMACEGYRIQSGDNTLRGLESSARSQRELLWILLSPSASAYLICSPIGCHES